jgi:trk system potassium uptake protein TrkA
MHIVVVGLGLVGQNVIRALGAGNHDVVAIDVDPAAIAWAEEHADVGVVKGFGASARVLREAGADRADLLVAVTNNDEVNLVAALVGRQLGARRTVVRVQGEDWAELGTADGETLGLAGIDVVFNPRVLVARELAKIARSHGALEVVDLADDRIEVARLDVAESSRLAGRQLGRLELPRDVRVGAVVRDGTLFIPGGADVILAGDQVYLVGLTEAVHRVQERFTGRAAATRVCIVGGGVAGSAFARAMQGTGVEVMIIERDAAIAHTLAIDLPNATIVCGDGTDLALLEEHRVHEFDLFAGLTQEDEVNLLAGLIARRVGVGRVAALVHRPEYQDIYRQLGIDVVLSPRTVAADHILRYCRVESLRRLQVLEGGAAEVMELSVAKDARAVGVPLAQLGMPRGSIVCAILKPRGVVIAGGEDTVEAGDSVILMTTQAAYRAAIRLFKPTAG